MCFSFNHSAIVKAPGNISNDHPKLDTRRMEPRLSVLGWKSKIIVSDIRRDDHKRSFESRHRNTHSRDFDDTIPAKYKTMIKDSSGSL